jgi:3-isopropylmalate/(R)-2-methylmalate dehydratase small subunit
MDSSIRNQYRGRAIVVRGNDIDTDRIIPARFLRTTVFEGLGEHAFEDDRKDLEKQGKQHPFDQARFAGATVLLVNKNFGCGSSREHAPQAIARWGNGIRFILGESFSEIFFGNCVALGIPCPLLTAADMDQLMSAVEAAPNQEIEVNLENKTVTFGSRAFSFEMSPGVQKAFIEGRWDSTAALLANKEQIEKTAAALPYFGGFA